MPKSQASPYDDLPAKALWRKGVADVHPLSLSDLYQKKFSISDSDSIATAGSCFAQHIGRNMLKNGFNFVDFEPAPSYFPDDKKSAYNYGVYSARYCNIYTVRQLVQTFDRAFDCFHPTEQVWAKGGGFVDAFRPLVEPEPFNSLEELDASRASHLHAARKLFSTANVLVFTLGLTEAWVSKRDGAVFPICPGTSAGTFSDDKYEFKNFTFAEIYADLKSFIEKVRGKNPGLKILLTVSPVPLTATATNQHILVATMKSKSILRAVADQVASEDPLVDYFPSYEIIAAPSMRGMFFEPNMRSVNHAGVDYVMSHFFKQHKPPTKVKRVREKKPELTEEDVICEEMLLDKESA